MRKQLTAFKAFFLFLLVGCPCLLLYWTLVFLFVHLILNLQTTNNINDTFIILIDIYTHIPADN